MPLFTTSVRRLVVAGGLALAVAAAPAVALVVAPTASACPAGESEDLYTDTCVPEMAPNVSGGNWPRGVTENQNQLPQVDGVPCTGNNTGQCIGLEESQGTPFVAPHSTLSSSP